MIIDEASGIQETSQYVICVEQQLDVSVVSK